MKSLYEDKSGNYEYPICICTKCKKYVFTYLDDHCTCEPTCHMEKISFDQFCPNCGELGNSHNKIYSCEACKNYWDK
jgi:hypothetical protein